MAAAGLPLFSIRILNSQSHRIVRDFKLSNCCCNEIIGVHQGLIGKAYFSKSSTRHNFWRKKQGLEPNPNSFSPLRLLPDYSFVDGRPVPLGYRKLQAYKREMEICKQIAEFSNELDMGLAEYNNIVKKKEEEKQEHLNRKLKPKGVMYQMNKDINTL